MLYVNCTLLLLPILQMLVFVMSCFSGVAPVWVTFAEALQKWNFLMHLLPISCRKCILSSGHLCTCPSICGVREHSTNHSGNFIKFTLNQLVMIAEAWCSLSYPVSSMQVLVNKHQRDIVVNPTRQHSGCIWMLSCMTVLPVDLVFRQLKIFSVRLYFAMKN